MATSTSRLLVAVEGSRACVRVCGRACFTCSSEFKRLVHGLHEKGLRSFVLELGECTIMDSTFLGILARFAQLLAEKEGEGDGLVLWNPPQRIVDLLDNLGVTQLFTVKRGEDLRQKPCEEVLPGPHDKIQSTRDALDAHRTLMEINPANEAKFKDVATFMAEDLKRLEKNAAPGSGAA